jgi:hypothetical protein
MPGRPAASMEKGSVRVRHVRLDLRDGGGEMPSGYARLREHLERHSIPLTLLDGEGALPPEEVDGPPPHKGSIPVRGSDNYKHAPPRPFSLTGWCRRLQASTPPSALTSSCIPARRA